MVKTILTSVMAGAIVTSAAGQDSLSVPIDQLESHVRSTLLFGGSSPVSFAGEARLKIQEHYLTDYPAFLAKDQTYTAANFEGNESLVRLGMVVRPNRNTVLWSKIGFQHTLPGNFTNSTAEYPTHGNLDANGFEQIQTRHDKSEVTANIHEDMSAGLAVRTKPASFWLRMGNVIWTEASPLTLWKAQPRNFAWDYLPYEIEQPIGRYYEYNIAKGEKSGRAAWNKKAINGIQLESIQLPFGIYANAIWGAYERYDNFEREYLDFSNDIALADLSGGVKGAGIGDSYRHLFHFRLAKENMGPGITAGFNLNWFHTNPDLFNNALMRQNFLFNINRATVFDPLVKANVSIFTAREFYKEPRIASLDFKGKINENWAFHVDLGASIVDTSWQNYTRGLDTSHFDTAGVRLVRAVQVIEDSTTYSKIAPAVFFSVSHTGKIPLRMDGTYISKDFYSPLSFVAPADAFYPFGSNLVGAGKFLARGEGSPYAKNMAGLNLSWTPDPGYGHFRITYGQHFQLQSSRDLIFFPHRLNGQEEFGFFQSSYNRWGNDLLDQSITGGKYKKRLGDESYRTQGYQNPYGPDAGGLRSDYLSMYEGFVPFADTLAADSNLAQGSKLSSNTSIFVPSKWVPRHQKWTFNFEVDGGYDIGPKIGYNRDFLVNGYLAINGISTSPKVIAFNQDNLMLWGLYARFEPAISLFSPRFYVLGLLGYENWRADIAYGTPNNAAKSVLLPINFKDYAAGVGLDWDFAERVGLHLRAKWLKHEDIALSENNYTGRILSSEIKMWF
jgi:hypothetical protein